MEASSSLKDIHLQDEKKFKKKRELFNVEEFAYKYRFPLTFLLLGLLLIGFGVIVAKSSLLDEPKIEVLDEEELSPFEAKEVVAEISGAVEKPGVYKLTVGSRVEDLLIAAGGISADADRVWVERMINRAAKLSDGQKIYIPRQGEQTQGVSAKNGQGNKVYQGEGGSGVERLININIASQKELEELPGIGPVYAQSIIEHRPYSRVDELLSKGALKQSVYEKVKDLVTAY